LNLFTALHVFFYRLTGGSLGGKFRGGPVLLLTSKGRKSGKPRTTPLMYIFDSSNVVLVASNGGRPKDPSWWNNLKKDPEAQIQIRKERKTMLARQASRDEKTRLWPLVTKMYQGYANYQKKTSRDIPVVILEPKS
jgi:deazaflavin-dependent oxidoreductase (nitroreductase family)